MQQHQSATKKSLNISREKLAWVTWGLGALFYYYEFSLQVSPSVMASQLADAFQVQASGLGKLVACYFYAYALMQIPVGLLLDRFGPRRMLTMALLICSLGSFVFSCTSHLLTAGAARFLIGVGSAFSVIGCLKLSANWFRPERFAFLTGLLLMIGMLGAAGGEAPLALLVEVSSWRAVLIGFGVAGIILAAALWVVVRDHPPQAAIISYDINDQYHTVWVALKDIIHQKQVWLVAIYGALMFAPTIAFGGLWAVPYLTRHFPISKSAAGGIMTLFFIGWAAGAPAFGAYSDYIHRRKSVLYTSTVGSMICICLLLYLPVTILWSMILLFLFGFFSAGFLPIFSIIKEITPHRYAATALGFTNTLNMASGALLQPLIGIILDWLWQGQMADATQRYYGLPLYTIALSTLPLCILIAAFFLPFIKETYGKSHLPKSV
ncbi:MAG: transporter [Gammaproteobacteria bacterium]|nr:transporter [Gammaproteobacteria bacterium]